jgi:hypothetical protein
MPSAIAPLDTMTTSRGTPARTNAANWRLHSPMAAFIQAAPFVGHQTGAHLDHDARASRNTKETILNFYASFPAQMVSKRKQLQL